MNHYKAYNIHNFRQIEQLDGFSNKQLRDIEIVGQVFPFKTNNYVINELIDWNNIPKDPIFVLNFPQRGMLLPHHFEEMATAYKKKDKEYTKATANGIRWQLNPHPAGQVEKNVPMLDGKKLMGIQHKYRETVLFFPSRGQTCHAYCTFCFRWPQFVGINEIKFAMQESTTLARYLSHHHEVSDVLFTGGDPLIMATKNLEIYLNPLLNSDLPHIRNIRFGTKTLSYWPYRFLHDNDSDDLLRLFERMIKSGRHVAIMAHFNHPVELTTNAVQNAIRRIRNTGAEIRTQSPLLRYINNDYNVWKEMWRLQVNLGCIPYYMFVVRDTGAQHYFGVPLVKAWKIFRHAYNQVSGLARTVRGPSMSAQPGKVQVLGVSMMGEQQALVLRFLQAREPDWVGRPFFAKYDDAAIWLDDLKPFFKEPFFFTQEEKPISMAMDVLKAN